MKSARLSTMKVGQFFIGRADLEVWRIIGWYLGRTGECPHVVSLTGETNIFAGCASPFGPFDNAEEATAALLQLKEE
jgi:hypothetical protein